MTVRSFVASGAVAALLIAAVLWSTREAAVSAPAAGSKAAAKATAGTAQRLSPSSVLAIDITKSSPPLRPASAPLTLAREYEQSRNLKAIYDRISPSPATAEAKYVLYRILSGCVKKTDPPPADRPAPQTWEQRRKSLEASLSDANPQKAVRLKAFDEMRRCQGMEGMTTSKAELDKLLDDAAREGDPRARALQVQREMSGDNPRGTAPITDAQLRTLQEAIASRDPAAIAIAGTVMSNTFSDMVVEVGDQQEPLDHRASRDAWLLLACEYGLDCGPNNNDLREACALSGRCGPASMADYLFYFETTPSQAQLVDQYRRAFRQAIDNNDWSGVSFARRPNARPSSVYRFFTAGP